MYSKSIPQDDPHRQSEVSASDLYPLSGIAATRNGNVPFSRIVRVLAEVGGALSSLHRSGRIHGNISIDSVGLDGVGHAYMMTAATDSPRSAGNSALRDGRASGYNAFEQYTDDPEWRVGPWTDIYAMCAVAYRLITGTPPPSAIDRCLRDPLGSLAERAIKGYPPEFLEAIDRGLALRPQDRFEDLHALLLALGVGEDAARHACGTVDSFASPPSPAIESVDERAVSGVPARVDADVMPASHPSPVPDLPLSAHAHGVTSAKQLSPAGAVSLGGRRRTWAWIGWPAGLAIVAALGYLWLGTETASPQISSRAGTGSGAQSHRSPPVPDAHAATPLLSIPPDIFNRNASEYVHVPSARSGAETASDTAVAPQPDSAKSDTSGSLPVDNVGTNPSMGNLSANSSAAENPVLVDLRDKNVVKPVSAVRISVDIRPWGEVFVDGASRGVSPPLRQLSLMPGSYQITVRNPNAPSHSKRVTISPGQRAVAITHQFDAP